MDVEQLRRELKAGTHRPAYLVSGPDTYLAEEALRALLESLLPAEEREFGLIRLYADQVEVEEVLDEARTIPFFGSRRLVVVRRVEAWQGLFSPPRRAASSEEPGEEKSSEETEAGGQLDACRQSLLEYLENPNPTTHLIFVGRNVDGRLPIVRRFRAMGAFVECKTYSQDAATRWVRERAGDLGCNLSMEGATFLVEEVGPDLQRLARELDKLAEYGSDGSEITVEVIERLVVGRRERSVFELTDAIGRQDVEAALNLLETLLSVGDGQGPLQPLPILGMLAWQVRRIWLVKDSLTKGLSDLETYNLTVKNPVKELSRWHGQRLRELRETARRFSEASLSRGLHRLLQADEELKGGGTSERRALETLVMDLCASGKEEMVEG